MLREIYSFDEEDLSRYRPIIKNTLKISERIIPSITPYDVCVSIDCSGDRTELEYLGVTGSVSPKQKIINLTIYNQSVRWKEGLKRVTSHEYNHIARFENSQEHSPSPIVLVADEGLAMLFEEEIMGSPSTEILEANPYDDVIKLWPMLKGSSITECKNEFFYNKNRNSAIPRQAGYAISYYILKQRKEELGLGWKDIIGMKSKELIGERWLNV